MQRGARRMALIFSTLICACGDLVGIVSLQVDPDASKTSRDTGAGDTSVTDSAPPPDTFVEEVSDATFDVDASLLKHVFVTSDTSPGRFDGGSKAADLICNDAAKRGALTGTYVAWLSRDGIDAYDRLPDAGGPWVDLQGHDVAVDRNQLRLGLTTPIQITEAKVSASATNTLVWTGTKSNGTVSELATCSNWTDNNQFAPGLVGDLRAKDGNWTEHPNPPTGCNQPARFYCFEQ